MCWFLLLIKLNIKTVLIAFIWLSLLSAIPRAQVTSSSSAVPPERIVGVKVNDWVKYDDFIATWNSSDPTVEPSSRLIDINETEWVVDTVQNVSGTNIKFQTVSHYKNGTEKTSVAYVDVTTGEGDGTFTFISSGLAEGDCVYASTEFQATQINETISRTYMGVTIETNYLNLEVPVDTGYTWFLQFYWDRATGILTEWMREERYVSQNLTAASSVSFKIVGSSTWAGFPVAEAGPDQAVVANTSVSFDASASYDPDGAIVGYEWDFGDETKGTDMTTTHTYTKPGTYIVTLSVRDDEGNIGTDTMTVTITVRETFPLPLKFVLVIAVVLVALLFMWRLRAKK